MRQSNILQTVNLGRSTRRRNPSRLQTRRAVAVQKLKYGQNLSNYFKFIKWQVSRSHSKPNIIWNKPETDRKEEGIFVNDDER